MQNIYSLGSDKWRKWVSTNIANNTDSVDAALAAAEQLSVDLGTETQSRIDGDANLQNQINTVVSGYLGAIAYNASAPTPARNGNYTFSTGGAKPAWLTAEAGVTTVKAGDGVAVVFTAPSSYTYTHVDTGYSIEHARSQSTSKVPSSKLVDDELNKKADIKEKRFFSNSGYKYFGVAPYGTLESESLWTITRLLINIDGSVTKSTVINAKWTGVLTINY